MFYAGVGSRSTPEPVLWLMHDIAHCLGRDGYTLRSGGAAGADQSFERGTHGCDYPREIYLATAAIPDAAFELAERYHPAWARCSDFARRLHARNGLILLGPDLDDPVRFVICWTPGGEISGGTGQALRIAEAYSIPVFNLAHDDARQRLQSYVRSTCSVR